MHVDSSRPARNGTAPCKGKTLSEEQERSPGLEERSLIRYHLPACTVQEDIDAMLSRIRPFVACDDAAVEVAKHLDIIRKRLYPRHRPVLYIGTEHVLL